MNPLKIIIVDDSAIYREGLRFFLEKFLSYVVISEASNGAEFLKLNNRHLADIILMDIQMPVLNGIEAVLENTQNHSGKVIAVTSFEEDVYLNQLIEAGFRGYLNKNNIYKELKNAIDIVAGGSLYFPDTIKDSR